MIMCKLYTLCLQVINVLPLSSHHVFIVLVCYPGARPCHQTFLFINKRCWSDTTHTALAQSFSDCSHWVMVCWLVGLFTAQVPADLHSGDLSYKPSQVSWTRSSLPSFPQQLSVPSRRLTPEEKLHLCLLVSFFITSTVCSHSNCIFSKVIWTSALEEEDRHFRSWGLSPLYIESHLE